MSRKKAKQHYCGVGGQAVLDGIMMRNGNDYAIAVRKTDGTIAVEKKVGKKKEKGILSRIPFVRGVVNFIDSLRIGFQSLNFSAEIGMEDLEEEPGRIERFLKKHFGDKANDIIMSLTVFAAVILAVAVFIMLPYGLAAFAGQYIQSNMLLSVFEGILRLLIFIGYVTLIGLMEDIDRMYMYHGAEHKCINCIERGKPLTVRNVRRSSRLHPRCGTSFMLYVMVISCVCFFFVQASNPLLRLLYRLLLIPVIAAVSYELIQLAGRSSNPIVKLLNLPGMGMQMLSTREPDDEMIEVAIQAVEAVFDWEGYQEVVFGAVETEDVSEEEPDGGIDQASEEETEYDEIDEAGYEAAQDAQAEYEEAEEREAEYAQTGDELADERIDDIAEAYGMECEPPEKPEEKPEEEPAEELMEETEGEREEELLEEPEEESEEEAEGELWEVPEEEPEELGEEFEEEPEEEPEEAPEAYMGEEFAEESEEDEIQRENAEILAYLDRLIAEEMKQDIEEDTDETDDADGTDEPEDDTDFADATGSDDAADNDDGAPDNADGTDGAYRVRSEEEAGREIEELLEHDL